MAIIDAARSYSAGCVDDQSLTYAPSVAAFCTEARRIDAQLTYNHRALPKPMAPERHVSREEKERMGFKMNILSMGMARGETRKVQEANNRGLEDMVALAQTWGVPIPESIWPQIERKRSAA